MGHRIGFVGTRFAGTDGVSLESAKWAELLWDHEHFSYWYGGVLDRAETISMKVPYAYFGHPDIQWIHNHSFGCRQRIPELTQRIWHYSEFLKKTLYEFQKRFEIEIFIVENALCIPMNIPLGVAITQYIAETGMPTIAHHHDFYWERDRYSVNSVRDFLDMSFPPSLPTIQHVTINSFAQGDLSRRKGESSALVPNVLDFENPPEEADAYAQNFRKDLNLADDDIIFLQPTRVVPRKGIEHSIKLVAELRNPKCKLVISHDSGDEGHEYMDALQEIAEREGVDLRFINQRVGEIRSTNERGERMYTLADAYSQSDFITYPSTYEGFGNALLEAFYYRKPVLVNRYSIFIADIEPRGFRVITMNGYLTRNVINHVQKVITDETYRQEMVDHNYDMGKAFFSYAVLRRKLRSLMTTITGVDDL
jgi:glycosyltransferase involved in cell wall biosynthesis